MSIENDINGSDKLAIQAVAEKDFSVLHIPSSGKNMENKSERN